MVYMICDKDQALLPQYQEMMIQNAEQNLNIEIRKMHIEGNHFPFLLMPEKCVDAIDYVLGLSKKSSTILD
jgi:hypothetical protein